MLLDTSVELTGDIFTPLMELLLTTRPSAIVGRWGVVTERPAHRSTEAEASGDVDAVEGYLMAFRRDVFREVGLLDEKYRFYRHLDLDFSFAVRSRGYRAVIDTTLPVATHQHVDWNVTPRGGARPPEQAQLLPLPAEVGRAPGPAGNAAR